MQAFRNDIARFAKLDAQVLGVSTDTLDTHLNFARELGLSFPLLVDDGSLRQAYGIGRITYLVDRSGVIRYVQKGMPENDRLIDELGAL